MSLQQVFVNQTILQRFIQLSQRKRLAHAYLFVGPHASGKVETALTVAKYINCEHRAEEDSAPCENCPACHKINTGNHPDVTTLSSDNRQAMKIAQIRDMIARSQLRPFEAKKKVYIIKDVELLSIEGSNAVLKTLEEPASDSLFILTSAVPERLLSTVKSRCHMMNFSPLSQTSLARDLIDHDDHDEESAHFLAFYSEGCAGKARILQEQGFLQTKNDVIDNIIFVRHNEPYMKNLLSDKDRIHESLDVLLSWFRDLVLVKQGVEAARVAHVDRIEDLERVKQEYTFDQLFAIIDEIVQTKRLLNENLNVKIAFNLLRDKIWIK